MFSVCQSKKSVNKRVAPLQEKPVLVQEKQEAVKETSQCFCHKNKGLPGWCGVAGGGVPACDH